MKLRQQIKDMSEEGKRNNQDQNNGLSQITGAIAKQAAGIASISAAWQAAKQAYQEYTEFQSRAGQVQSQAASGQLQFLQNTITLSHADRAKLEERVKSIAKDSPVVGGIDAVYRAAGSAQSAAGTLSVDAVAKSVELASKVAFSDPMQFQQVAGGINTAQRVLGKEDPEQALGFLLSLQGKARVTDVGATSENLLPAVRSILAFGGSTQEAGAVVTTLGGRVEDPTGSLTGTNAIKLATQLAESLPQLGSTAERIRFLQGNAGARDEFLSGLQVREQHRQPIRELLTPGTQVARQFEQDIVAIGSQEEGRRRVNDLLGAIESSGIQQTAAMDRIISGQTESNILDDLRSGQSGVIRDRFNELLQSAGVGWSDRVASGWGLEIELSRGDETPAQDFIRQVRDTNTGVRSVDQRLERIADALEKALLRAPAAGTQTEGAR